MKLSPIPLIVIAGATASGKSALALRLALHLKEKGIAAEILSADSIAVYRGFEIGAAKPTQEERAKVPHHLLDLAGPMDSFTAGDFVSAAEEVIRALHARGTLPILAGGTGFYLRALLRGMASSKDEDETLAREIKARLLARAESEGMDALYREVIARDPGSLGIVHPNDHYRVVRALQAMELHAQPWSELNRRARATPFRYPGTRFFCLRVERAEIAERVRARTEAMLKAGLLAEVEGLLRAGVAPSAKPMQSVGYLECVAVLEGREQSATLAEKITQSTLRLVKAQGTWFRGEKGVEWLEPDHFSSLLSAINALH